MSEQDQVDEFIPNEDLNANTPHVEPERVSAKTRQFWYRVNLTVSAVGLVVAGITQIWVQDEILAGKITATALFLTGASGTIGGWLGNKFVTTPGQ